VEPEVFVGWLRKAFGDGYTTALLTPGRLRNSLNMDATFERWYQAHMEQPPE
jgi:hypothetical protein